MKPVIEDTWKEELSSYISREDFKDLITFIKNEYKTKNIYPKYSNVFNALNKTPFNKVNVIILGQDPYHGPKQANGLAFSTPNTIKTAPSLKNIFKELYNDLGISRNDNDLSDWAEQGVLLLNSVLTVEDGYPTSHANKGWEEFTDHIVQILSDKKKSLIFVLWGSHAQNKGLIIDRSKHHVIESPHPSPLSAYRGFFGSKPFSQINSCLREHGKKVIMW